MQDDEISQLMELLSKLSPDDVSTGEEVPEMTQQIEECRIAFQKAFGDSNGK